MNKIEKHYNNYYKTKSLSHRILANRDVAERLQKSCAQYKISKIIDIGAGTGNLLKEIEKIKLGSEYHAVEINQKSVDLIKKLRIKILNNMKSCKVKPLKIMFPNLSQSEYNKIPSTNGYNVMWTKDKIAYNFASVYPDGVINQVLKLE